MSIRTSEQFLADLQPIIDRLAGPSFRQSFHNVFHCCKAADRLPDGCDGCRETLDGRLICCVNQQDEE